MTVYLAGLGLDFVVVGMILLVLILAAPHGLTRQLLCVAFAETLLAVPTQFMVFMRTDLYFVLQDLTRCANLYSDGSAYLRHLTRRVIRRGARIPTPAGTIRRRSAARSASTARSCWLGPPSASALSLPFRSPR